jgi:phenylpyruvate tautomerase PptA (4-oxalocrotonate tautomerase family)
VPIIELTYTEGALDATARAELPAKLAAAHLKAERAPDTDFFRSVSWTLVNELPADCVHTANGQADKPQFLVQVTTPDGALSDRRREELVKEATALILEAAGLPEEDGLNVFIIHNAVPEGSWGAAGNVVHFEALREAAKAEREKAEAAV